MQLSIENQNDTVTRISVSGRVTQDQLAKHPQPLQDLLGNDVYHRNLLLSMRDTEFLDSSGVSWLLVSHKKFQDGGGHLVLHSIPQIVLNVIKVLRMNLIFDLADNADEALKKVQENAT